ncbi:unnamed protein product [Allacma fusca]|uniref:Uncharacterized protein n=1 Tax=Allacma fusca TaxID=39272 RepID=A0A8J2JJV9_9HEXA|nr:unnamed protein product [Allacma fusca]
MNPRSVGFRRCFITALIAALVPCVLSWKSDMPGGIKFAYDEGIYSFTTDMCPGGVFFKKPLFIPLVCTHGYFFRRSNGCKMENSDVIAGSDYACEKINVNTSQIVQAFIPITNPDLPLDHTISFYDDPNTLRNFRRFSYIKGLEEQYSGNSAGAAGVVVANARVTPPISIGELCYEGRGQSSGSSYVASLDLTDSTNIFSPGCKPGSRPFPWKKSNRYFFTKGYSSPSLFPKQVHAVLKDSLTKYEEQEGSDLSKFEIWDGLAYCLQTPVDQSEKDTIKLGGIYPRIETLKPLCHSQKGTAVGRTRSKRFALRRPYMGCLARCVRAMTGEWAVSSGGGAGGDTAPPPPPPPSTP